jgi:hypothetical protein
MAGRRSAQLALSAAIAVVALFHAYAWWFSARAAAGAPGAIRFYAHATSKPVLGWTPWIVLAGVACVALMAFAAAQSFGRYPVPLGCHPDETVKGGASSALTLPAERPSTASSLSRSGTDGLDRV